MKRYIHNCLQCTFVGHFCNHDVYKHGPTLVARYSDERSDYRVVPIDSFENSIIGGDIIIGGLQISMQDAIRYGAAPDYYHAFLFALAKMYIEQRKKDLSIGAR